MDLIDVAREKAQIERENSEPMTAEELYAMANGSFVPRRVKAEQVVAEGGLEVTVTALPTRPVSVSVVDNRPAASLPQ